MWDIPTIYSPQDFSPKEENFGQLRKPGESPCRQKSLCHGKLSSRMCFWGCGKRKQNAAHSEKFICLTGQLQIHPSPAWHQWKKKTELEVLDVILIQSKNWVWGQLPFGFRVFLSCSSPGSSRDEAAGAGLFVPSSSPFLAGFYLILPLLFSGLALPRPILFFPHMEWIPALPIPDFLPGVLLPVVLMD